MSSSVKSYGAITPGEKPKVVPKPTFFERFSHGYQRWALQRRWGIFRIFVPLFRFMERLEIVKMTAHAFFLRKREIFGDNYVAQGALFLNDFDEVVRAITSPQARTYNLGALKLEPKKLPNLETKKGRMVFTLAISSLGAGGKGDHEAFHAAMRDTLLQTESTKARCQDETAQALLADLVKDYKELGHGKEFFEEKRRGLHAYLMKFLHYAIFDIDPNDTEKIEKLNAFHYDTAGAAYYLKVFGTLFTWLKFKDWRQRAAEAVKVYHDCPMIADFPANDEKYNHLTREELATLMMSVISIAALGGPKTLLLNSLGYQKLPSYEGTDVGSIDVLKILDEEIDLDDPDDVVKYFNEVSRLMVPVATAHRVATEPITVPVCGKDRTFPAGTVIIIPMSNSAVDESFWGPSAFQFDRNRENLLSHSMMYNSVGMRHGGRICPGFILANQMITDILVALGKARREPDFIGVPKGEMT